MKIRKEVKNMQKIKVIKFVPKAVEIEVSDLTDRQFEYINKIEKFKKENLKVPTIREIGVLLDNITVGAVYPTLETLKDKGYYYNEVSYKDWENGYE